MSIRNILIENIILILQRNIINSKEIRKIVGKIITKNNIITIFSNLTPFRKKIIEIILNKTEEGNLTNKHYVYYFNFYFNVDYFKNNDELKIKFIKICSNSIKELQEKNKEIIIKTRF